MNDSHSLSQVIGVITEEDPRYPEKAYLFILSALNQVIDSLPEPRHITGQELSEGCRKLALKEFGPMARTVLAHWGITSTEDFGELIYNLLDRGILSKTEEDSKEDFIGVFDFDEAFRANLLGDERPTEREEEEP